VSPTDESTWPAVDQRIEEYLDSAVREWLPKAFPAERTEKPALTAQAALRRLALVLERRHDDLWLTNMIQERPSRTFSLAVLHLSNSVEKDKGGDADRARTEASEAIRLFSQSENSPGAIRAQLELVYALHRASQGGACLKAAAPIQRTLPGRRYSWIEAQLLLEKAVCFRITDDLKETDLAITAARKKADEAKFDSMALRAVGFQASLEWSAKGNEPLAWSLYYKGLSDFWAGNYPEMRAYQFYSDLCAPAENHGHWQLALGCSAEAAILTARMDDLSLKALAHFRVSRAALMAGQSARSKIELGKAEKAFEALPSGPAKESYRLDTEIRNAGIESAQGDPALALDRLNKLEAQAQDISNDFMAQNYFQELGDVEKKLGEMKLAQQSYRAAIEKAEKGFSKLNNKRDRRGWQRLADAAYRGLAESQFRDNQTTEALETWESYRALPLHEPAPAQQEARTSPTAKTPASVEVSLLAPFSVRQGLPLLRHETLISYAIFPNGLAIWAYDDRGITSKMVPVSADELERAVRRFNEQCADPESDIAMLQQNGKRLYQWLIAPVESFLESSRQVVVEPDGILGQVAIQALVDSRDEYFGARYSLVFTPSLAHYFQALQAKNPGADSPALVVGSSLVPNDYAGMLQPLPDAILESQIVGKILSRSKVMDAQDLTAEMLLQKLAHVEIFHFAGHAITTADGVRLVLTAPGGEARFIDADLFRRTEFKNLRLVVLSACSTAHGGETEDGFGNLIEALLETGVPRAIGSYWDVDSKITVMLIQRLYQGIAEGKRVPLALHEALSRGREVNKHPYYWATFHVWV
jgi:CHAT domain-containing protein